MVKSNRMLRRSKRLALLRRNGTIANLQNDIIRQLLLRVPYISHSKLKAVCKKWKDIVSSPGFYKHRLTSGTSDHLICMIQYFRLPNPRIKYKWRKCIRRTYTRPRTCKVIVLDPATHTWAMLPGIPDFHIGVPLFCKCVCVNGKLVLMGGRHPGNLETLKRVYIFDFVSGKWRRGTDMPTLRIGFACSVSSSAGLIYVAGGTNNQHDLLAAAATYNVEEDKWENLPPMSQEVGSCHGVFLGDKFFVFGDGKSAEIYDPKTGLWRRVDDMWRFGSSFTSSLVASRQLYTLHQGQLMKYVAEENDWVVETVIPSKFCGSVCSAEWRGHIFLSKRCNNSRRQVCCLLNLSTEELIEFYVPEKFEGVATAAATLEI